MKAARYLNVPPWELAEQPLYWQSLALAAEGAENAAAVNRPRSIFNA